MWQTKASGPLDQLEAGESDERRGRRTQGVGQLAGLALLRVGQNALFSSARRYGVMKMSDVASAMATNLDFAQIHTWLGDVDETFDTTLSLPYIGPVDVSATVKVKTKGIRGSLTASKTLFGQTLLGKATLSTTGGVDELRLSATADLSLDAVGITICPYCPSFNGTLSLVYYGGQRPQLTMDVHIENFMGLTFNGFAEFDFISMYDLLTGIPMLPKMNSFRLVATLDYTFCLQIRDAVLGILPEKFRAHVPLDWFRLTDLDIQYNGGALVYYNLKFIVAGEERQLQFPLLRFVGGAFGVTAAADFALLIVQLGLPLLQQMAPFEVRVNVPETLSQDFCTPPSPCWCGPNLYCPDRRRLEEGSEASDEAVHPALFEGDEAGLREYLKRSASGYRRYAPSPDNRSLYLEASLPKGYRYPPITASGVKRYRPLNASLRVELDEHGRQLRHNRFCFLPTAELNGCCGDQLCIQRRLKVTGYMEFRMTKETMDIKAWAQAKFDTPGFGLRSIDKTFTKVLSLNLANARTLCDLFPDEEFKELDMGDLGGGFLEVKVESSIWSKFVTVLKVAMSIVKEVNLKDLIPCERLTLDLQGPVV